MICPPCRENTHRTCASGTHCDCQHKARQAGIPAGSVREPGPNVQIVSYAPVTGTGAPGSKIISVTANGAGQRGMNGHNGLASGGTGTVQLHTLTHWWYDSSRWVGAL